MQVRRPSDPEHPCGWWGSSVGSTPVNLWGRLGSSQRRWCQITACNGARSSLQPPSKLQQMCDMKANPRYRGVPNAAALSWASQALKFRSHPTWMTEVRRRVIDTESDNMADMVLSQGGTSVSSRVQCEYKTRDHGRRYASAIAVQRCSNLVRANVLPAGTQDFDRVNAMTNRVFQALNRLELPQWLPVIMRTTLPDSASRSRPTSVPARRGSFCPSLTGALYPRSMTWTPPGV